MSSWSSRLPRPFTRGSLDKKNSPSRFPFRPPLSMTFPLRVVPSNSASTYSGSVLGATGNLGAGHRLFKVRRGRRDRNLRKFNYPHFHSRLCSLWITPPRLDAVESGRAAPPTPGDLTRGRVVHLGPRVRPLHLARGARGGRERCNGVRLRRCRGVPDLPLRDGLRSRRAATSARAARRARALISRKGAKQEPRQRHAELVPEPLEHRRSRPRSRDIRTVREQEIAGRWVV